jgi:putative ABC transport system permease protein
VRRLRQWLIRPTTSMTRRYDETRRREEIDDHVAFETDANLRRGLPPAEARRRALLTFGSMETFKENYRDQQGVPALEHLLQDVRIALRRMWKTPGFTATAIATLALGLGLTSAVMSLAYSHRLSLPRLRAWVPLSRRPRLRHQFPSDLSQQVVGNLFFRERPAQ